VTEGINGSNSTPSCLNETRKGLKHATGHVLSIDDKTSVCRMIQRVIRSANGPLFLRSATEPE
jgi:hypothetical protein